MRRIILDKLPDRYVVTTLPGRPGLVRFEMMLLELVRRHWSDKKIREWTGLTQGQLVQYGHELRCKLHASMSESLPQVASRREIPEFDVVVEGES